MINGERVKQARELRSMTQKELATHIGVTQAAIAQIEGEFCPASDALITAIAAQTELPLAFFEKDIAPSFALGSLLFRAHAPITRRERIEAYRHAQLTYEVALFLYSTVNRIPVNIQMLSEEPSDAARLTRKALGLQPDEPVPHLLNILEHHGAIVLRMPELKKRDAFSLWADNTPLLAISDGRSGDRLRMTCAHELGHLVMHSKKLTFKVDESEADVFASEFLMPAKAMRRELKPPITLSQLAELKPRWKVSIEALIRRARHLRLLAEREHQYLADQLTLQGWNDDEPVQLRPEKPRGPRQLAEMFYGIPIDYERLAVDTSLTTQIVREILECYAPHKRGAQRDEEQDLPVRGKVVKLPLRQKG